MRNLDRGKYISDEAVVKRANAAVQIEIEKDKAMDVPVVSITEKNKSYIRKIAMEQEWKQVKG